MDVSVIAVWFVAAGIFALTVMVGNASGLARTRWPRPGEGVPITVTATVFVLVLLVGPPLLTVIIATSAVGVVLTVYEREEFGPYGRRAVAIEAVMAGSWQVLVGVTALILRTVIF